MSLEQVAKILGCAPLTATGSVTGWSIDSRTTQHGDLFFALPGERRDGHDYVAAVLQYGAIAAVVDRPMPGFAVFQVSNTEKALADIAAQARTWWDGTVIGVTGSAGKTSTKDIVAALVAVEHSTGKTIGNLNNHLGVPLSLLRLPETNRYAVLEMGMNHAGEIRQLCEIAKPHVAVVTNVGYAHIENFPSIEGIAAAKAELVDSLPADGLAVLNNDDPRVREFVYSGKRLRYGINEGADVRPDSVQLSSTATSFRLDGVAFSTNLTGRHSLSNVLAGLTVARELGTKLERLQDAVASLTPAKMRGERRIVDGMTILDDCYNSNPDAARAMLDVLAEVPATRRIAVLGEMLELGSWAEELHRGLGNYAATTGVTVLIGIRGAARHLIDAGRASGLDAGAALFFESPEEAGDHLRKLAREGDAILFKGSRGTRVELALARFLEGR
jgi:UDP-N-acetylmuramoyl-tripeptide--D-alanyl-D-alanine ligase